MEQQQKTVLFIMQVSIMQGDNLHRFIKQKHRTRDYLYLEFTHEDVL